MFMHIELKNVTSSLFESYVPRRNIGLGLLYHLEAKYRGAVFTVCAPSIYHRNSRDGILARQRKASLVNKMKGCSVLRNDAEYLCIEA
jgi:hypothetical protein